MHAVSYCWLAVWHGMKIRCTEYVSPEPGGFQFLDVIRGMSYYGSLTNSLNVAWDRANPVQLGKKTEMTFAGHIHLFEHLSFEAKSGKPDQFVFGGGGTSKDRYPKPPPSTFNATSMSVTTDFDFGAITPTSDNSSWQVRVHSTNHDDMKCGEMVNGKVNDCVFTCLLYTSPSPRDKRQSRMPSSA